MGITERRDREKERRRQDILDAAWAVAEEVGWPTFSVERVAARAELGRATVYGYFASLDELISAMAEEALELLSKGVAEVQGLTEGLDVPLRLSQRHPAAFALLFQQGAADVRPAFSTASLSSARAEARRILGALHRLASRAAALPPDAIEARVFLAGIAMASVAVPELRSSTPLRRRWQDFCLAMGLPHDAPAEPLHDGKATGEARGSPVDPLRRP
jgi:AcrR family transcriptional regulator